MNNLPTFYQILHCLDVDCTVYVSIDRGPWKSLDRIYKEHSISQYVNLRVDLIDITNAAIIINCRKEL